MKKILLAPHVTGTGHNMRMFAIGKKLLERNEDLELIALIGSRQDIFIPLFEKQGIKTIDLNPNQVIDYSKESHLEKNINWNTMMTKYYAANVFNSDKVFKYINILNRYKPDLLICDYNISASIAAIVTGTKYVFVTERHNITLVDNTNGDFTKGGFTVNEKELVESQETLNCYFEYIANHTERIITDKVILEDFDREKYITKVNKVTFVGSIYAERDENKEFDFLKYNIDKTRPYIVGTVSSTTMLKEDKEKNVQIYIETFKLLKKSIPELQLILLGDLASDVNIDGLVSLPYIPNWKQLILNSNLIISHPGWISVTELSYLNVPALFYLSSFMEFHEVEAYRRLEFLGLPVFEGEDVEGLSQSIIRILTSKDKQDLYKGYKVLSPYKDGLLRATKEIENVLYKQEVVV